MGRVVKRAYKYRFYPTLDQADLLNRTFGCVRLVYNRALAERTRVYTTEHRSPTYAETSSWLTEWKQDRSWGS
jgi:putative transposase